MKTRWEKCVDEKSTIFAKKLLLWGQDNKRDFPWRKESSHYKILVAEKLLQQTDVGHVTKHYDNFFNKYPTLETLAKARQEEIELILRPLGFWRIRARDLKRLATQIIQEYSGDIPSSSQELKKLFGVGEYVAKAVSCFAFGNKEAIVDVNVRRIVSRFFLWKSELPNDREIADLMFNIMPDKESKEFNWALLDYSATVCSRIPKCHACFAKELCEYFRRTTG
jgi:A/G-specific adenine glycosylase